MFAVSEDKISKAKISLKDFPKTGTVVRLLSARTGPDEIDIVCEGLRRVSLLEVSDIRMNIAKVRYPEIEYRLANPSVKDKLSANAQALRQSLERASDFEKKYKKLRREMEQYAQSIGVRIVPPTQINEGPSFALRYTPHLVGRISLGKLNTLLDFLGIHDLSLEQKVQLAAKLARPSEEEYAQLKSYIMQLSEMVEGHRETLAKDLERISPETKAIADSLLSALNPKFKGEQGKDTNEDTDKGQKAVFEAVLNQASSGSPMTLQDAVSSVKLPVGYTLSEDDEPLKQTKPIEHNGNTTKSTEIKVEPVHYDLESMSALTKEQLEEQNRLFAYRIKDDATNAFILSDNRFATVLQISDADYEQAPEQHDSNVNLDEVFSKVASLLEKASDNSTANIELIRAQEREVVSKLKGIKVVDFGQTTQDKATSSVQESEQATSTQDNAEAKADADAKTEANVDASAQSEVKSAASAARDLFDLFTLLNEVGRREAEEIEDNREQFKKFTIDSIVNTAPRDEYTAESNVEGPTFGFVNEDTSVVTFKPGQDSSEELLLKLTQIQKEQEKQLKEQAAASRASKTAQDIIEEIGKHKQSGKPKEPQDKDHTQTEDASTNTEGKGDIDSSKIRLGETTADNNEITAEFIADGNLPEGTLAKELSGLFTLLNDDKDAAVDKNSKWAHLQRAALIRTKLAELLGGKVVFGVGSTNPETQKAQYEVELRAYCLGITAALQELLPLNPLISEEMQQYLTRSDMSNPSVLADCAASITQSKPKELQEILDTIPILPRLKLSFKLISRDLSAAKLQDKIKVSVAEKIQKRQKEFFLREQLNEIKSELGLSADEKDLDVEKFRARMKKLTPPEHIKERFEDELGKLSMLEPSSPEYGVTRNYLDIITTVPWGKMSKEKLKLDRARKILDQDHEGLKDIKDRIIEFMAVGALKGQTRGQIMLFVGPPGVGKTSIGKSIAKALNRPFFRLSLGGIDDVSEIKGHRKTYVGAMPGKLVNALRETKVMNPVIMLDEIDKLGRSYHGDPDSALLETLDPEQNKNFLDVYLDEKLDLSNCLFICTANSVETISAPLLDRMDPINLSGYIAKEKFAIAKKHLIPRALEEAGIKDKRTLQLPDDTVTTLIEGYARESGVRSLERSIAKLIRKSAVKLVEGQSRVVIKPDDLEEYLGTAPFKKEKMLQGTGIVTGLAWTKVGGVTLPVESIVTSIDTAGFKLTGSLGDVMKESANIALSFVQSNAQKYTAKKVEHFFKKKTVHLHVPEGATPKDGPSAGITMATSLLSLVLDTAPKAGFAMTGELTLTGHVLPIGGLREKVIAARRMGIFNLVIPIGNEGDVKELPDHVKEGVTFYYADTYDDVAYVMFDEAKEHLESKGKLGPRSFIFHEAEQDSANAEGHNASASKAKSLKTTKATKVTKETKETKADSSTPDEAKATSGSKSSSKTATKSCKRSSTQGNAKGATKIAKDTAQDTAEVRAQSETTPVAESERSQTNAQRTENGSKASKRTAKSTVKSAKAEKARIGTSKSTATQVNSTAVAKEAQSTGTVKKGIASKSKASASKVKGSKKSKDPQDGNKTGGTAGDKNQIAMPSIRRDMAKKFCLVS